MKWPVTQNLRLLRGGKLKKDKRRALLSTVSKDLGLRGNCDQSAMSHGCTKTAVGVHGAK